MALSWFSSFYLLAVLYLAVFTLSVSRLHQNQLTIRSLSSLLLLSIAYLIQQCSYQLISSPLTQMTFTALLSINYASLGEMLVVSRFGPDDLRELAKRDGQPSSPLMWEAICLACNLRRVGTRCQIRIHPQPLRSRGAFLAVHVPRVLLGLVIVDAMIRMPQPEPHLVSLEKQTVFRLWTMSMEDVGFRTGFTAAYWFLTYVNKATMVYAMGVLAVALGLSDPKAWPPVNGPVSSAYTLRRFWGVFWHQSFRKTLTGWGDTFSDSILCIPRQTLASRYMRLAAAFAVSGIIHQNMELSLGMELVKSRAFAFFLVQAVGIMLEDGVQALASLTSFPPRIRRGLGYAWVFFFLWLTTPTWAYPELRMDLPPMVLPVSPLDMISKLTGR